MVQSVAPKPGEIVLLSGHDLRRLLNPKVVIEALREAYAALADNPGDQGRSVGFLTDGGSIHVKSGPQSAKLKLSLSMWSLCMCEGNRRSVRPVKGSPTSFGASRARP